MKRSHKSKTHSAKNYVVKMSYNKGSIMHMYIC